MVFVFFPRNSERSEAAPGASHVVLGSPGPRTPSWLGGPGGLGETKGADHEDDGRFCPRNSKVFSGP